MIAPDAEFRSIHVVADVHVHNPATMGGQKIAGVNERCDRIVRVLEQAHVFAASHDEPAAFIIAGDLLDSANVSPQVMTRVMRALEPRGEGSPHIFIVPGNHEIVSDGEDDHGLGPIAMLPNVSLVTQPTNMSLGKAHVRLLPFVRDKPRDWMPAALDKLGVFGYPCVAVVAHFGIEGPETPAWLVGRGTPAAWIESEISRRGIPLFAAGDWHNAADYHDKRIAQVGALVPTGFDNPGAAGFGQVLTLRAGRSSWERTTLAGPRFYSAGSLAALRVRLAEATRAKQAGCVAFVRAEVPVAELDRARAMLIEAGDLVAAFEVLPSSDEAAAAAIDAAAAARTAASVDVALVDYVQARTVAPDIDKQEVISLASDYVKKAGRLCGSRLSISKTPIRTRINTSTSRRAGSCS